MQKRLKFERERLGYSQEEFAKIAGTTRVTQIKYEKDSEPKAGYFNAIYNAGADIFYILTGQRIEGEVLSNEEKFLLDNYRVASRDKQRAVLGALLSDEESVQRSVSNSIGNISDSTVGNINQGGKYGG